MPSRYSVSPDRRAEPVCAENPILKEIGLDSNTPEKYKDISVSDDWSYEVFCQVMMHIWEAKSTRHVLRYVSLFCLAQLITSISRAAKNTMADDIRALSRWLPREYGPFIDVKLMIRHGVMIYSLGPEASHAERRRNMKTIKNMCVQSSCAPPQC